MDSTNYIFRNSNITELPPITDLPPLIRHKLVKHAALNVRIGSPTRSEEEPSPLKRGRAAVVDLPGSDDVDDEDNNMIRTSKKTKSALKVFSKKELSVSCLNKEYKKFQQTRDFDFGCTLLEKYLTSGSYDKACEISSDLYNLLFDNEPVEKTIILLKKFEDILSLGEETIGPVFYAWVLGVLTWHTEEGHIDWRSNKFSDLVKCYEESTKRGCFYARYNLANLLAKMEYNDEAVEHYLLYVKECPEPLASAYAALGTFYEKGWKDQPVDLVKAEYYYNLGHLAGSGASTCNLAVLKQGKEGLSLSEIRNVCKLYKISGERGFADGWYNLGVLYMEGWLGKKISGKLNIASVKPIC